MRCCSFMKYYKIEKANSPIIVTAIHDGHLIPDEIKAYQLLNEGERFREEDPFTGDMARLGNVSQVHVQTSRFYTDLNRAKAKSIYLNPEDAWGLNVWQPDAPKEIFDKINAYYDEFYLDLQQLIEETIQQFGYFFIVDIHSYNHKRKDAKTEAPIESHPEVNLGTFYNAEKWNNILNQFKGYLSHCVIKGKYPDVRENVIFKGGGMAQWVIQHFGDKGAVVSVEFKKTFMDEWTGRVDIQHIQDIKKALTGIIPLIEMELIKIK